MRVETKMPHNKAASCLKALALLSLLCACRRLPAQESQQAQPATYLHSNDRFGVNLMNMIHEESPDRNIVVAPLPVSLTFAALLDGSVNSSSNQEIISAFQWERSSSQDVAGRMLLARFRRPRPYPTRNSTLPKKGNGAAQEQLRPGKPEEMWLSAAFLYRGEGSLSQEFIDRVKYFYGFDFRAVGEDTPQSAILAKNWDSSLPMPAITGSNDFWITSFLHLRTSWAGNTFVYAKREKRDFKLHSGNTVQADFLKSETATYRHVHEKDFEAVVLTCWQASVLFVLPERDEDIGQLLSTMTNNPGIFESSLTRQQGDVLLPPFHFSYEGDFRKPLEKMGVRSIFHSSGTLLSLAPRKGGGMLQRVAQRAEIIVDEHGIRADAGTLMGGVFGGIEMPDTSPFHMILNRPFLFLIRDNATNALLFSGVVMNPTVP
jgi:serine protease inhibitor